MSLLDLPELNSVSSVAGLGYLRLWLPRPISIDDVVRLTTFVLKQIVLFDAEPPKNAHRFLLGLNLVKSIMELLAEELVASVFQFFDLRG